MSNLNTENFIEKKLYDKLLFENANFEAQIVKLKEHISKMNELHPNDKNIDKLKLFTLNDNPIINDAEQQEIKNWCKTIFYLLDNNGFNRKKKPFKYLPNVPNIVYDIQKRIEAIELKNGLELNKYQEDDTLFNSVGVALHGSQMHKHIDTAPTGFIHIRYNVYVSIPVSGGLPIYSDKLLEIKEKNYVCCRSSIDHHFTLKTLGPRPRIVLSYGYYVPEEKLECVNKSIPYI